MSQTNTTKDEFVVQVVLVVDKLMPMYVRCKDVAVSERGDLLLLRDNDFIIATIAAGQWISWCDVNEYNERNIRNEI